VEQASSLSSFGPAMRDWKTALPRFNPVATGWKHCTTSTTLLRSYLRRSGNTDPAPAPPALNVDVQPLPRMEEVATT
jgi:hypothetical protein